MPRHTTQKHHQSISDGAFGGDAAAREAVTYHSAAGNVYGETAFAARVAPEAARASTSSSMSVGPHTLGAGSVASSTTSTPKELHLDAPKPLVDAHSKMRQWRDEETEV